MRLGGINKTCGLGAVDCLAEGAMQESILDVELMNRPILRESHGQNSANSCRLDDWAESLIIINTGALCEATKHRASLVSVERAVSMKLVMKNPLAGDDVGAEGTWNKVPPVVGEQGTILLFHRSAPIRIG